MPKQSYISKSRFKTKCPDQTFLDQTFPKVKMTLDEETYGLELVLNTKTFKGWGQVYGIRGKMLDIENVGADTPMTKKFFFNLAYPLSVLRLSEWRKRLRNMTVKERKILLGPFYESEDEEWV